MAQVMGALEASAGQHDSFWTPLDQGLHDWDDLCTQLLEGDSVNESAAATYAAAPTSAHDQQSSVHGTLHKIATMLAKSNQAQALHGRTTMLLTRQVLACLRGSEVDALSKTVQGIKDSADWVQQVHRLNTELKVQRYSWQQLHGQLVESQALVQRREAELLGKEQQLLVLQAELDAAQQQQRSRLEGQRCVVGTLHAEVLQLRSELERRNEECKRLKSAAPKDTEAAGLQASLLTLNGELQLKAAEIRGLKQQLAEQQQQQQQQRGEGAGAGVQSENTAQGSGGQQQAIQASGGIGSGDARAAAVASPSGERPGVAGFGSQAVAADEAAAAAAAAAHGRDMELQRLKEQLQQLQAAERRRAEAAAAEEQQQQERRRRAEVEQQQQAAALEASQAQALQAAVRLESERELAENLSKELELIQARLASLQQEHGALKLESSLLSERAMMSEDGLEEARQAAEEMQQSAQAQVDALRSELQTTQERLKEAEQDAAEVRRKLLAAGSTSTNGTGHSRRQSHGGVPGPSLGTPAAEGRSPGPDHGPRPEPDPALARASEGREAAARVAALEQELAATRAELHTLLDAGRRACEELGAGDGGGMGAGPEGQGAQPWWGVLRCAQLLFPWDPQGTGGKPSLARVRVLQAQMEDVLQVALRGNVDEPSALLQELHALRRLQRQHDAQLLPRTASYGSNDTEPRRRTAPHAAAAADGDDVDDPQPRRHTTHVSSPERSPRHDATAAARLHEWVGMDGGWDDGGDDGWLGARDAGGPSATTSGGRLPDGDDGGNGDDSVQGLGTRWELPPLAPPPIFD